MNPLELVTGPHVLWVGSNGRKTYGITVRATGTKEEVELKGFQRQFNINDYMIARMGAQSLADQLGLTLEEAEAIPIATARLVQQFLPLEIWWHGAWLIEEGEHAGKGHVLLAPILRGELDFGRLQFFLSSERRL